MPKVDPRAAHRHRAHATHSGVSRPDYDRDFSWPRLTNGKGQARKSRPTWFGKLRLLIGLIAIVLSGWAIAKASGLAPPAQAVIARAAQAVFVKASTGYNHLLDISGLRISQISVTGAQKTGSTAVFDALPVGKNANLFAFDATLAAQHVEALPWVERASITRVLPGQLHVHVQEETAAALWSLGDRLYLLNQQGKRLAQTNMRVAPPLPLLIGDGAAVKTKQILTLLHGADDIRSNFISAERISQRRWRLRLTHGRVIELPAAAPLAALRRVQNQPRFAALLRQPDVTTDLRAPGFVTTRSSRTVTTQRTFPQQNLQQAFNQAGQLTDRLSAQLASRPAERRELQAALQETQRWQAKAE